jgi:hypothetical protein
MVRKVFLILAILLISLNWHSFAQPQANVAQLSAQIGKNFVMIGLKQLRGISALRRLPIWDKIEAASLKYATQRAEVLLNSKIRPGVVELLMERSAVWYGEDMVRLYNGANPVGIAENYIRQVNGLFNQIKLPNEARLQIFKLIRDHFKKMSELLKEAKQLVEESNPMPSP